MNKYRVDIVFSDRTFSYDKNNGLVSFSITNQSMADNKLPSYDIINAYGQVEIIDSDKSLYDYLATSKVKQSAQINIYVDDVLRYKFISTKNWNYNVYDYSCSIDLASSITKWQGITLQKKELTYDITAYQIYEYLKGYSGNYNFIVDTGDVDFLKSIVVPYFYLEKNSLWEQWRKFCELTQCQLYQDIESNIIIKRYQ